jgi:hypothetical protein
MAGEYVDSIRPRDLFRLNGAPINMIDHVTRGSMGAARLLKSDNKGYTFRCTLPGNWTYSTGLTFNFDLTDDGADANDLGAGVRLGVTIKKINGGSETTDIAVNAGTEQNVTVTLSSTTNTIVSGSLAIANANLDSAGAGDTILVRVRRIGTDAADTAPGPVLFLGGYIKNT